MAKTPSIITKINEKLHRKSKARDADHEVAGHPHIPPGEHIQNGQDDVIQMLPQEAGSQVNAPQFATKALETDFALSPD